MSNLSSICVVFCCPPDKSGQPQKSCIPWWVVS
jgi:hypothetical protein